MKKQEAIKMLTVKVECMRRETSGIDVDCNSRNCDNCELCYAQGTMGEQQEALTMAISALQAQDVPDTNVSDMTSKKAVKLALLEKGQASKRYKLGEIWELNFDEIREALATVPPLEPEQRWIPVSERLPESPIFRAGYLATVFCASWKEKKTMYVEWENVTIRGKAISRWIWDNRLFPKEWEIIAWMPLPKAYKEGDE